MDGYQWTDGTTVLANTTSISPSLSVGTHTLTFTVTDNGGASASDRVIVTIVANQAPTADAGSNQSVTDDDDNGSETVTLSGSASDADGSIVSYHWTEGTTVLGNTSSISPSLSVGTHTLTLTVTDNGGASTSDEVVITIVEPANQDPAANAGADQTLSDNDGTGSETVTLVGSGSDLDGNIVSYQWTDGATVLGNTADISPSLAVGTHTLTLTVTDNDGAMASDSLVVTIVANQGPSIDEGADQTVIDNDGNGSETVTLNVFASDSDGSITSYQWSDGTTVIGTTSSITPTLDVGTHTFTLTVADNGGATATDTIVVIVEQPATEAILYVYDIRFESAWGGWLRRAAFEIRSDSNGDGRGGAADAVAAGVAITVEFNGQTYAGTTDANGVFRTAWNRTPPSGTYAEVVNLVLTDHLWDPLGLDLEDDSDGNGLPDAVV